MDSDKFFDRFCNFDCQRFFCLKQSEFDNDKELNFSEIFQNIATCKFYCSDDALFASRPNNFQFIFHTHVRSLNKNFVSLYDLIYSLPCSLDLLTPMPETWLKPDLVIFLPIRGYEFINVTSDKRAGGVAMYVSKNLVLKSQTNLI